MTDVTTRQQVKPKKEPAYHCSLTEDFELIHAVSRSVPDDFEQRANIMRRITDVLRSMTPGADNVNLVNLNAFPPWLDVTGSQLDLVIEDMVRPEGLLPDSANDGLPGFYNAAVLSDALSVAGFDGTFIQQARVPGQTAMSILDNGLIPPLLPRTNWTPDYQTPQWKWPMLPPTLHITSTSPPVLLRMPHPAHMHLQAFIQDYCRSSETLAWLVPTLVLWTRSWGLVHFSHTLLALMAIHWYQLRHGIQPMLQKHEAVSGFWVNNQRPFSRKHQPGREFARVDVYGRSCPSDKKSLALTGPILLDFTEYWAVTGRESSRSNVLSVSTGQLIPRKSWLSAKQHALSEDMCLELIKQEAVSGSGIVNGRIDPNGQPVAWISQRLVVSDPFIPQFNHAHEITSTVMELFTNRCALTARDIGQGFPALALFGTDPSLIPELRGLCAQPLMIGANTPTGSVAGVPTYPIHASRSSTSTSTFVCHPIDLPHVPAILPEVHRARSRTVTRVEQVVQNKFGQDYTVACFGSTRYGVSIPSSDLDLVILDRKRSSGFAPQVKLDKLPDVYNVSLLAHALRDARFHIIQTISQASVPVVKFRDPQTGMICDINVNDQLGLYNTFLIARFCELQPNLPHLVFAIKTWAKSHGLNNPSSELGVPASFSSYALTMMTIGFLQMKGLLPSLQTDLEELPKGKDDIQGTFWLRNKDKSRLRVDHRFNRLEDWRPPTAEPLNVQALLQEWFKYWAYEFQYTEQLISVRHADVLPRTIRGPKVKKAIRWKDKPKKTAAKKGEKQDPDDVKRIPPLDNLPAQEPDSNLVVTRGNALLVLKEHDPESTISFESSMVPKHVYMEEALTQSAEGGLHSPSLGEIYTKSTAVDPTSVNVSENEVVEGDYASDCLRSKQPPFWTTNALIVVDPFILSKNVTASVSLLVVYRFVAECDRAAFLLHYGKSFHALLGNGALLGGLGSSKAPRNRGRDRGRGSADGPGRGNGRGRGQSDITLTKTIV